MAISDREMRLAKLFNESSQLVAAIDRWKSGTRDRSAARDPRDYSGMSRVNYYEEALEALHDLSEEEGIPMAIVGGAASIYHGYPRFTDDVDIVVRVKDFERIARACWEYGFDMESFNPTGFHVIRYKGVKVEVIQEGSFGQGDPKHPEWVPSPAELGVEKGVGFTNLVGLVRLKLGAGRIQDEADIVSILKVTAPEKIKEVQSFLKDFGHGFLERFDALLRRSIEEKRKRASL